MTMKRATLLAIVVCTLLLAGTIGVSIVLTNPTSYDVLSDTPSAQGKDGECLGLDLRWSPCVTPIECRDPEALNRAVLSKLYSRIPATLYALQRDTTALAISKAWLEISRLKQWAASIEPECVRVEYLNWLEYYETELSDGLTEIQSGGKAKAESDYQKYVREQEELQKRADALEMRLPEPPSALDMAGEKETP